MLPLVTVGAVASTVTVALDADPCVHDAAGAAVVPPVRQRGVHRPILGQVAARREGDGVIGSAVCGGVGNCRAGRVVLPQVGDSAGGRVSQFTGTRAVGIYIRRERNGYRAGK